MKTATTLTLGEVASVRAGHPFRGSIPYIADGNVRAVQLKDVSAEGLIDWGSTICTSISGWKDPDWLKPGDILFMYRGTRTMAVYISDTPFPAVSSPNFYLIRVTANLILPDFLAWQLNQVPAQSYLRHHAEGSGQLHIRRSVLEEFRLSVPPLAKQQQIVQLANCARDEAIVLDRLIKNRARLLNAVAQDVLK